MPKIERKRGKIKAMFHYRVTDINDKKHEIYAEKWELKGEKLATSLIIFSYDEKMVVAFIPSNIISIQFVGEDVKK